MPQILCHKMDTLYSYRWLTHGGIIAVVLIIPENDTELQNRSRNKLTLVSHYIMTQGSGLFVYFSLFQEANVES